MKKYKVVVSFGDGLPKEAIVAAKNGIAAHEAGFKLYPAARSINVVCSLDGPSPQVREKPHLFFGYELTPLAAPYRARRQVEKHPSGHLINREAAIAEASRMREAGLNNTQIGLELGVHRATVRKWFKALDKTTQTNGTSHN